MSNAKLIIENIGKSNLIITELPIGEWTDKYIRFLEENILSEKTDMILDFDNYSTEKDISIKIVLSDVLYLPVIAKYTFTNSS